MELSFVIATNDEAESLPQVLREVRAAAHGLGRSYEIVVVDDGSTDGSGEWLAREALLRDDIEVVCLEERQGQSASLAAGIAASRGQVIITLDADLQNDPRDAGLLLAALEFSDLASGVRVQRHDRLARRVGSRIANRVRRCVLKDRFRDVGCTLKAWRRSVAVAVPKFRGFHRFIPILAEREGFRVVEVAVSHRPRRFGKTHYGNTGRAVHGLADLFGVAWMLSRRIRRGGVRKQAGTKVS